MRGPMHALARPSGDPEASSASSVHSDQEWRGRPRKGERKGGGKDREEDKEKWVPEAQTRLGVPPRFHQFIEFPLPSRSFPLPFHPPCAVFRANSGVALSSTKGAQPCAPTAKALPRPSGDPEASSASSVHSDQE